MIKRPMLISTLLALTSYAHVVFATTNNTNALTTLDWSNTKDGLASLANCQTALTQIIKDDHAKQQDSTLLISQLCSNTIAKAFDGVAPEDMVGFTATTGCTPIIPITTFNAVFTHCRLSEYPECLWDQAGVNVACSKQKQ